MDKEVVHIYNGICLSQKRMKRCHLQQQEGPRGHCAERNKSERERQMPYDFTLPGI